MAPCRCHGRKKESGSTSLYNVNVLLLYCLYNNYYSKISDYYISEKNFIMNNFTCYKNIFINNNVFVFAYITSKYVVIP